MHMHSRALKELPRQTIGDNSECLTSETVAMEKQHIIYTIATVKVTLLEFKIVLT